jgi:hypothetical protein
MTVAEGEGVWPELSDAHDGRPECRAARRSADRSRIVWLESDLFPNIVFGCIAIAVVLKILSTLCGRDPALTRF